MSHPRPLVAAATLVALCTGLAGCPKPVRRKGTVAPPPTTGQRAVEAAQPLQREKTLPPATMSPAEIRAAIWDIRARQRKGEAGLALDDYADRASQLRTLEARFLAATAIPDDEQSWEALRAIRDDQPRFYWAYAGIAAIYVEWKIRDQGEKAINTLLELGPQIPYAYTLRGDLYRAVGEHEQALRDYEVALRADPGDADARTGQALSKKALGDTKDFRRELEQALKNVPTQWEAALSLALFLDEQNVTVPARKAWEHVETLAPKYRAAQLALARLNGDLDPKRAIVAYEKAATGSPLTKPELEALARLYRKVGRGEDETKTLQAITKFDAKDPAPWKRLVEIWRDERRDPVALEGAYKAQLTIDEKDPAPMIGLAVLSESKGEMLRSMDWYNRAKTAGSVVADNEIARLAEACLLPKTPHQAANLAGIYRKVYDSLGKLYGQRVKAAPGLAGTLSATVRLDEAGRAIGVELEKGTLKDPYMDAHLQYALLWAQWPKPKPNERKFTLDFELPQP